MTKWVMKDSARNFKSRGLAAHGSGVVVIQDIKGGFDPGLGKFVGSRSDRRELCKRFHVVPCGDKGACDPRPEPKRDNRREIAECLKQVLAERK